MSTVKGLAFQNMQIVKNAIGHFSKHNFSESWQRIVEQKYFEEQTKSMKAGDEDVIKSPMKDLSNSSQSFPNFTRGKFSPVLLSDASNELNRNNLVSNGVRRDMFGFGSNIENSYFSKGRTTNNLQQSSTASLVKFYNDFPTSYKTSSTQASAISSPITGNSDFPEAKSIKSIMTENGLRILIRDTEIENRKLVEFVEQIKIMFQKADQKIFSISLNGKEIWKNEQLLQQEKLSEIDDDVYSSQAEHYQNSIDKLF